MMQTRTVNIYIMENGALVLVGKVAVKSSSDRDAIKRVKEQVSFTTNDQQRD